MFQINLNVTKDPKTWSNDGVLCYFDPVSKRLRKKTPEETVRQKILSFLTQKMGIPSDAISVEVPVCHFAPGKRGRIDILVNGYDNLPLLVVECKAPQIHITNETYEQVDYYAELLGAPFAAVTNGHVFQLDYWDDSLQRYQEVSQLPSYHTLCTKIGLKSEDYLPVKYQRTPFDQLCSDQAYHNAQENQYYVGQDTPRSLAPFIINLAECLLDPSTRCTGLPNADFRLVADQGIRYTAFGDAGGGTFSGPYRTLMVDVNGNTKLIGFSIFSLIKSTNDPHWGTRKGASSLVVSIDDKEKHHMSLELTLDTYALQQRNEVRIWHGGRMAVSNIGSVKQQEVLDYVFTHAPYLKGADGKVALGTLKNDHLFTMSDSDVQDLLGRLIQYALLRDELRYIKKQQYMMQKIKD